MVSISGIDVKFGRIAAIVVLTVLLVVLYKQYGSGGGTKVENMLANSEVGDAGVQGKSGELPTAGDQQIAPAPDKKLGVNPIPMDLMVDSNTCKITYLRKKPATLDPLKPRLVLLHGAKFTADDWDKLGTLSLLNQKGYDAVAITVNYKDWEKCTAGHAQAYAANLDKLIKDLELLTGDPKDAGLVIVSPSLSGIISIPYILDQQYVQHVTGYIAIAPVVKQSDTLAEQLGKLKIKKTLLLRGSKDTTAETSYRDVLGAIPGHEVKVIDDAGHACYLKQPDKWHEILFAFLGSL